MGTPVFEKALPSHQWMFAKLSSPLRDFVLVFPQIFHGYSAPMGAESCRTPEFGEKQLFDFARKWWARQGLNL